MTLSVALVTVTLPALLSVPPACASVLPPLSARLPAAATLSAPMLVVPVLASCTVLGAAMLRVPAALLVTAVWMTRLPPEPATVLSVPLLASAPGPSRNDELLLFESRMSTPRLLTRLLPPSARCTSPWVALA